MTGQKGSKEKFSKLNNNSLLIGKNFLFLKKVISGEKKIASLKLHSNFRQQT